MLPDVSLVVPYDGDAGRTLADSLYLADLLWQLGGELGLRIVRYAHVDTLMLGGGSPLSQIAAAEQLLAAREDAADARDRMVTTRAQEAIAAAMAADPVAAAAAAAAKSRTSRRKGGAAAVAAEAAAATEDAAAVAAAELDIAIVNDEEEPIIPMGPETVGDLTMLPDLYVQLLKNLLVDVWESSSMQRNERRWLEVLDEGTWPEVLRRYAISRAGERGLGELAWASWRWWDAGKAFNILSTVCLTVCASRMRRPRCRDIGGVTACLLNPAAQPLVLTPWPSSIAPPQPLCPARC